jgi:dihydropteroate synthase
MHMHRDPQTMQVAPMQGDVIEPVKAFLRERAQAVREAGVADSRVVLDPGIGFGKTVEQNFELLSLGEPKLKSPSLFQTGLNLQSFEWPFFSTSKVHP